MSYTYATNIRQVMLDDLSQFSEVLGVGSNVDIGFSGWDKAYEYSRANNMDYFGAIFVLSGDTPEPTAFGKGMWRWSYLVRMHVRYDGKDLETCDNNAMTLAANFLDAMSDTENRQAIASSGWAKLVAANYLSDPLNVNDVVYLSMEFIVTVQEQID